MTEIIPVTMREDNPRDQRFNELRPSSALDGRRYSVSPEQSIRFDEYEERITEGSSVAYHGNPPYFHPLLPGENVITTDDFRSLTTQEGLSDNGTIETKQAARPKPHHTWRLEICAVVLSLCAMVALTVLLTHADDQPLDEWRFFISFNALISILGAVARAPLGFVMGSCLGQAKWNWFKKRPDSLSAFGIFEDASRGPMGSLRLLSWLHVRHWSTLGSLMTIILLGFDPFLQAVVDYSGQSDLSTRLASPQIGISERLDVGSYSDRPDAALKMLPLPTGENISSSAMFTNIPDVGMTAALINGLSNETKTTGLEASFSCLSGNCTWAPYTTLATCSRCNDVTAHLTRNTTYGSSNLATIFINNMEIYGNYTKYALPYVDLTNGDNQTLFPATMAAAAVSNPGLTVSFQKLNTLIVAVGIIRAPSSYDGSQWPEHAPLATECALYFCTKAYSARVDHGLLLESVIGTWSDRDPRSYRWLGGDDTTFQDYETWNNHSLRDLAIETERYDLQLRISEEEAHKNGLPDNVTLAFNISQSSVATTSYATTNQLFSEGQMSWPLSKGVPGPLDPLVAQAFGTRQTKDYPDLFANVSQSMTKFMRDHSNTMLFGEQTEWVIHIRVRWVYLILPVLVIVGASLVLVFTIIETKHRRLEPWKSDVLATFTHSIDAEIQKQLRFAEMEGQAKHTAKNTVVSLVDTGDFVELKAKID